NSMSASYGTIVRWRPSDDIEITPFWSRVDIYDWETRPFIYTAGAYTPPRFKRNVFFGQPWTDWREIDSNYGALGTVRLGHEWRIRAGAFHSSQELVHSFFDQLSNTLPDGSADHTVYAYPQQKYASTSGEARVERLLAE